MPGMPGMGADAANDPVALGLIDGSLQQRLAYEMNQAMDRIRENSVRSIEDIMLDQVINYADGQGACTTVECLLTASVEAARIFILE